MPDGEALMDLSTCLTPYLSAGFLFLFFVFVFV